MDDGTQITAKPRKRKPRGQHPDKRLSAAFVRNAPVGRHCDGNGLYLVVKPTGARSWIQRIAVGRRRDIGLGSVRLVPLADAREKALVNRKRARDGGDPLADRRRAKRIPLFAAVTERVWNQLRQGWRHPRHARDWWRSFENHVLPRIGQRPVSEVTADDVLEILEPIWHTRPKLARRLRQRIRAVLECAVALEHRADNPCDRLGPVLGPHDLAVRHFQALPHAEVEVAAAVAAVHGSRALPALKLAFEFLVLTAGRSGEVRGALVGRGGPDQPRVDRPGLAHEGEARAPGSALRPGGRDPRRGADAWRRRQPAGVPRPARQAAVAPAALHRLQGARDRRRAARLPLVVLRLPRSRGRVNAWGLTS